MFNYLLRRLIYMLPIMLGVILLTFLLFNLAGGDPALQAAGKYATQAQIESIRAELGLTGPWYVQFFKHVEQLVTFQFGRSWSSQQLVSQMIWQGLGPTLSLSIPAFVINILVTLSLSLIMVQFRGRYIDRGLMFLCLTAYSLSSLVYIIGLQYLLSYDWGWFPISGWSESWLGRWEYLSLPILIFVLLSLSGNVLYNRTAMLDIVHQDYVRTARAKGLGPAQVMLKHVLTNSLKPLITLVIVQLPFLITGSVLIESFFGIPGLGSVVFQAIQNADFPVIKAMTFISALIYMLAQVLADVLYVLVDPQVRLR